MDDDIRTGGTHNAQIEDELLCGILSTALIKTTDTYQTPPQIIWIDSSAIATLGNFSASTGKAKSKKTFNVSAIVAAAARLYHLYTGQRCSVPLHDCRESGYRQCVVG